VAGTVDLIGVSSSNSDAYEVDEAVIEAAENSKELNGMSQLYCLN
jgi:hypothetical protein